MKKWEYHVEPMNGMITTAGAIRLNELLDSLGNEGWELVNIIPQVSGDETYTSVEFNHMIFKRELD